MANMMIKTDLVYDTKNNLALDLYYDSDHASRGALIDIHGGGWFRGDKAKDADWATTLADAGYLVVVPNYRITPAAYYPAPLADMDQVVAWLQKSDYDFDHKKIGVVGSSAGGNMAIELGIKYGFPIVSLSGIIDIAPWLETHQDVVAHPDVTQDFTNSASAQINQTGSDDSFYKWFVTNYFADQTDKYHAATPFFHVTPTTGPMYLANSLNEFVPLSGVTRLVQALSDNGIPSTSRLLVGTRHAKGYLADVSTDVLAFLDQTMP